MARRIPLASIPSRKFPLTWKRYSRLYDELQAAAQGFADTGHPELAAAVANARDELYLAWSMIRATEDEEQAAAARRENAQ